MGRNRARDDAKGVDCACFNVCITERVVKREDGPLAGARAAASLAN